MALGTFQCLAGDGVCTKQSLSWATAHDAASADSADSTSSVNQTLRDSIFSGDSNYYISRMFFPADTSSIGAGMIVNSGTLYIFTANASNTDSDVAVIVPTTQSSTGSLVVGDYSQVGTLNCGSLAFTSFSSVGTGATNAIPLNASGLAQINVTGTTKLGLRGNRDLANSTPTGLNQLYPTSFSEDATSANRPYYILNYSSPAGASLRSFKTLLGVGI